METEKFKTVISYFSDNGTPLSEEIKNTIEDVFKENEKVDAVQCYFLEDIDAFEHDMTFMNETYSNIETGEIRGTLFNIWTYYGDITYNLREKYAFVSDKDNEVVEYNSNEKTVLASPDDYVIILVEKVNWNNKTDKEIHRELTLNIYCPKYSEEKDGLENKYAEIYNEIKGEDYDQ